MGSAGGSEVSPAGAGAAAAAVERARLRPHQRADAGGRGRRRQAAAAGLGGRDRRRRSPSPVRRWSTTPGTARRSNSRRRSTTCCWLSWPSSAKEQRHDRRTGGQGRDRHRRSVGPRRRSGAQVRRRGRQGGDRRRRRRTAARRWRPTSARTRSSSRPTSSDVDQVGGAGVDGRRALRRPARDGQQRRSVGHDAPSVPRRRPRGFPQGDGGQRAGGDGGDARRRAAHVGTRRRVDHQPDVDRRHPGRRRRDDLPGVEGRCHPVHQVCGNRVGALRDSGQRHRARQHPHGDRPQVGGGGGPARSSSSSRRRSASRCATTAR